ncbi:FAD binding domain-containing protein [Lentinula raphanica]|nr:FAD binding domain-containing protein [Lentinula raphanica]
MSTNVLIVGAGPTGLALALLLLRNGLTVRIIEKQFRFHPGERGSGIQPRTLELYKFLGILPDIHSSSAYMPEQIKYYSAPDDGKPPRTSIFMELLKNSPDRPLINTRMLGQNRHEQILREHILKEYDVRVELSTELQSFEQHPDHVLARMIKTNDSKQIQETATVEWLIGADGARSVVRKQLGLSFLGESPAMEAVTGDIYVEGDTLTRIPIDEWPTWTRPQSEDTNPVLISMRPCKSPGKTLYQFFLVGAELDSVKISSNREEFIKAFHEITGRRDIGFGELVWIGLWRPNIRMVDKFSNGGRVFIAGGGSRAIPASSYSDTDFFHYWQMQLMFTALLEAGKTFDDNKKRAAIRLVPSQRASSTWDQLSWQHSRSGREIYADTAEIPDPYRSGEDGTARGGDRAPDAPSLTHLGANGDAPRKSFFDLFTTTQHTALIFSGLISGLTGENTVTETSEALRKYPSGYLKSVLVLPRTDTSNSSSSLVDMTLVDTEGWAYKNYAVAVDTPTVIIVRPDGYIGALVTSGGSGIRKYFSAIFSQM